MSIISNSGDDTATLVTYTTSGETRQSASLASNQEYDFLDFLGVAQCLKIDFLPITWQPALDGAGEGGTAIIHQALINVQTNFVFKRLKHPWSAINEFRNLRALLAEISVLGHPAIRYHPNIANIEGICWDVVDGGEQIWPVLVFEKTRFGDLNKFMTTSSGKELDIKNRLDILFDIALAVRDLHAADESLNPLRSLVVGLRKKGVIHGDIKPKNILIFPGNEGRYMARVTDFGYSTLFSTDNDPILMPNSGVWTAPEQHHRAFLPRQARKMDAYSFGMLCLWLLFYNNKGTNRNRDFKKDLEDLPTNLLYYASELLRATPDLGNRERVDLQKVFTSTLAQDPTERTANFDELLEFLSPSRVLYLVTPKDRICMPYEEFEITLSIHQLIEAHYGVRYYIVKCLEQRGDRLSTSHRHSLNLAFCYELGFGIGRDINKCSRLLLTTHGISKRDLEDAIERLKRLEEQPDFQSGLFRTLWRQSQLDGFDLSQQYREEQRSRKAEERYQREISTMESVLGNSHFLVEELRSQLSGLIHSEGRWVEAEERVGRMIELEEKISDNDQPAGVFIWRAGNLVLTYSIQGRWKEAEKLQVQVVELNEKFFGTEDPKTITAMFDLASIFKALGRSREVEQLTDLGVQMQKKVFGVEHPETSMSIAKLAKIYGDQKRHEEAEELQTQVVERRNKVLGTEHPATLRGMEDLASTYCDQKQWEKAEDAYVQVLELQKRVLGVDHPTTLSSMSKLASTYSEQGRRKESEILLSQVIEIKKRVLGADHPLTLFDMGNLALLYSYQEDFQKEAEELCTQVIEMSTRVSGAEHPNTLTHLSSLASIYSKQVGRLEVAEGLEVWIIEASKKVLGPDHPDTLANMSFLARIYWGLGRCETEESKIQERLKKAEELELQVTESSKRVLGTEHPDTLNRMIALAHTYNAQGRDKEKEELLTSVSNVVSTYKEQMWWKEAKELETRLKTAREWTQSDCRQKLLE